MATANVYGSFNNLDPVVWYGVAVEANASDIILTDGFRTGIYYGQNFTYDANGRLTGGLLIGYAEYHGNVLAGEFYNFSIPAVTAQLFVNANDLPGLFRYAMAGNDVVHGSTLADRIGGYAGNDLIFGNGSNDYIDGGDGRDTAVFTGSAAGYGLLHIGNTFTLSGIDGVDTLVNVERLEFGDGRVALDIDGTNGAGAAYRIYQAAFDRTPDVGGLTFWTEQADKGMSTIEMSARFIDSNEFRQLYGSSNLPADTFVAQVYENVLHRAGEQGGVDYWVGQINSGMSEAEVLARFADSAENRADVIGIIGSGIWLNSEGDYA